MSDIGYVTTYLRYTVQLCDEGVKPCVCYASP